MKSVIANAFVAMIGGTVFYLIVSINSKGIDPELLGKCAGCGSLAGVVLGALRELMRRKVPLLHSWEALFILMFAMPIIIDTGLSFLWQSFFFGYGTILLWDGYHNRLPKFL